MLSAITKNTKWTAMTQMALIVVIVVMATMLLVQNNTTSAQDQGFTGQKWEYQELVFTEPVTFGSTLGAGYFLNGNFREAGNPEAPVRTIFGALGGNGWELVTSVNNQVFIFKRPAS